MAHEVETLAFAGKTPWHRIGTRMTGDESAMHALVLAGLGWTVETVPLVTGDSQVDVPARAVRRTSDGRILGVVGTDWTPLQNAEVARLMEPILASGLAKVDCVASLRNGQRIFFLAKIAGGSREVVPGDTVDQHLLLSNGHDGTMSVRFGFTNIRTVCANTIAQAHRDKSSRLLRLRHTSGLVASLERIREVMDIAAADFAASTAQYQALARKAINKRDLAAYVKQVFPKQHEVKPAKQAAAPSATLATFGGIDGLLGAVDLPLSAQPLPKDDASLIAEAGAEILERITEYVETGVGHDIPGVRGTMWGAYNAVTEYLQHGRGNKGTTDDRRLDSMWFGDAASVNRRALDAAVAMSAGRMGEA